MPGRLASVDITQADTNTRIYECDNNAITSLVVNVCNRNNDIVEVNLAITDEVDTPLPENYIEFHTRIYAYGVLVRPGIVLSQHQRIIVLSDTPGVSVNIWGWRELR